MIVGFHLKADSKVPLTWNSTHSDKSVAYILSSKASESDPIWLASYNYAYNLSLLCPTFHVLHLGMSLWSCNMYANTLRYVNLIKQLISEPDVSSSFTRRTACCIYKGSNWHSQCLQPNTSCKGCSSSSSMVINNFLFIKSAMIDHDHDDQHCNYYYLCPWSISSCIITTHVPLPLRL